MFRILISVYILILPLSPRAESYLNYMPTVEQINSTSFNDTNGNPVSGVELDAYRAAEFFKLKDLIVWISSGYLATNVYNMTPQEKALYHRYINASKDIATRYLNHSQKRDFRIFQKHFQTLIKYNGLKKNLRQTHNHYLPRKFHKMMPRLDVKRPSFTQKGGEHRRKVSITEASFQETISNIIADATKKEWVNYIGYSIIAFLCLLLIYWLANITIIKKIFFAIIFPLLGLAMGAIIGLALLYGTLWLVFRA